MTDSRLPNAAEVTAQDAVPRFGAGMRLRHDQIRNAWVVLGPERLFLPDDHATAVLRLIDGVRTIAAIVDDLAARYDAPREAIAADVLAMLDDLARKGAIRL